MNNASAIRSHYRGDHIVGTYFGVAFEGVVWKDRRNTASGAHEMYITLDAPIVVLGDERQRIMIDNHMTRQQCTVA